MASSSELIVSRVQPCSKLGFSMPIPSMAGWYVQVTDDSGNLLYALSTPSFPKPALTAKGLIHALLFTCCSHLGCRPTLLHACPDNGESHDRSTRPEAMFGSCRVILSAEEMSEPREATYSELDRRKMRVDSVERYETTERRERTNCLTTGLTRNRSSDGMLAETGRRVYVFFLCQVPHDESVDNIDAVKALVNRSLSVIESEVRILLQGVGINFQGHKAFQDRLRLLRTALKPLTQRLAFLLGSLKPSGLDCNSHQT
ncbi:hypothetical protein TGRUB_242710 [Toxoplasma gondii RUB]|uniref:Uncharacterized protein n=2 Tax=Toxoplasma gondii TaxID=5811 RepID=A0A086LU46_TOXGO|nr:hypothetical protein TGRUB_242710 [Toxoplasma gondii RUB]KFH06843.1 hypothetical protein TGMAS_242710 [Toxoplasma gondii MAS]